MSSAKYASEGELFKKIMGADWFKLKPNIQKRFSEKTTIDRPLRYIGTLTELKCSFWGKILAYLTQPFIPGALIPYNIQSCPVDIQVYTKKNSPYLYKLRVYKIPNQKPITFVSYMAESEAGEILEYVGFGVGMKLIVFEKEGNCILKVMVIFLILAYVGSLYQAYFLLAMFISCILMKQKINFASPLKLRISCLASCSYKRAIFSQSPLDKRANQYFSLLGGCF